MRAHREAISAASRVASSLVRSHGVEGLGYAGDVVNVPAGFTRSKLIQRKAVLPPSPKPSNPPPPFPCRVPFSGGGRARIRGRSSERASPLRPQQADSPQGHSPPFPYPPSAHHQEVEGLGYAGDQVNVPARFARNKLIPHKATLPLSPIRPPRIIRRRPPCPFPAYPLSPSSASVSPVIQEVEGLGYAGDQVNVPAGFARNKLIPQKAALPAIPKFLRQVRLAMEAQGGAGGQAQGGARGEAQVEARGEARGEAGVKAEGDGGRGGEEGSEVVTMEERVKQAEEIARRLDSQQLSIRAVTPKRSSELRQPITQRHIISEVRRQFGIQLSEANVPLSAPLSSIGDFEVPLRFPRSVPLPGEREQVQLDVRVRRR
ncbi:unnamed protein product [Closterium sp. NIES-65]|nr:unnamed protein product [Closterium sp. NIES-65]